MILLFLLLFYTFKSHNRYINSIENKDDEISILKSKNNDLNTNISKLKKDIIEKDDEMSSLNSTIQDKEKELANVITSLEEKEGESAKLQNEIDGIVNDYNDNLALQEEAVNISIARSCILANLDSGKQFNCTQGDKSAFCNSYFSYSTTCTVDGSLVSCSITRNYNLTVDCY